MDTVDPRETTEKTKSIANKPATKNTQLNPTKGRKIEWKTKSINGERLS